MNGHTMAVACKKDKTGSMTNCIYSLSLKHIFVALEYSTLSVNMLLHYVSRTVYGAFIAAR